VQHADVKSLTTSIITGDAVAQKFATAATQPRRQRFAVRTVIAVVAILCIATISAPCNATMRAGLLIEVVLHSHFTQTADMKCVGWGIYDGINDRADLLVHFGDAADVANKAGGGVDPSGQSCSLFYGLQVPLVDTYQLQFLQSDTFKLGKLYGPYSSSLLVDPKAPAGTRQLFADLP
jgi:hypothetical protein